jgi:hypothetical protein
MKKEQAPKSAGPAPDKGNTTPGLESCIKFQGNKPKGETHSSDGKGHYSGH